MTRFSGANLIGWIWLAVVAALAMASSAQAADRLSIKPSLSLSQEYETNVLYSASQEEHDSFTRVHPSVEISSDGERQNFLVRGELNGRYYRKYDQLDALDSSLHVEAGRAMTRRFRAFFSADLVDRDHTDPIEDGEISVSGRGDLSRRWAQGGISYGLDSLTTARLMVSASKVNYGERNLVGGGSASRLANDYDSRGATLLLERVVSGRDVLGAWVTYDLFDFSSPTLTIFTDPPRTFGLAATEQRRTRLGLSWQHALSPVWSMGLRGGPRWLHTEGGQLASVNGNPTNLPEQTDDSLAFNGDITLTRTTPISTLELGYSRDTRPSTDRSASENVQDFSISFSRKIGRRFSWRLKGLWREEESSSASNILDRRTFNLHAELRWRIRRDFYTFVGYSLHDQEADRTLGNRSVDSQRFKVGFRYTHDLDFL
jgi:hypothetical protein